MIDIRFAWVCRNRHFGDIQRIELTDAMLIAGTYPSWITSDNCEVLAKIRPTGLQDKHGTEIYEGDILGVDDGDDNIHYLATVVWGDDGTWVAEDEIERTTLGEIAPKEFATVIGNIHANPELVP